MSRDHEHILPSVDTLIRLWAFWVPTTFTQYTGCCKQWYKTTRTIAECDSYPHQCPWQSWYMGKMGSAHCPVGVNIWVKFEENPSISKEFIECTWCCLVLIVGKLKDLKGGITLSKFNRVMKLVLHMLLVIRHISFKFQANGFCT